VFCSVFSALNALAFDGRSQTKVKSNSKVKTKVKTLGLE